MPIRVRFAPSPTGPFSLGNARTALFNWLFAQKNGGDFLLRIEDTDKERSKKEYEEGILKSLAWLGFNYTNEIIRQSERTDIYKKHLENLIAHGFAYYCFCTPEELTAEREEQESQGIVPKYSGRCASLDRAEALARAQSERSVIRFRMPERRGTFHDSIRRSVAYDTGLIGDIVIAKSVTEPLYNFAVVVDDADMNITHVIRGEDHLSNTPKQIMIAEALGMTAPQYAHLPLILGQDRKKLSKRFLEKSFFEYEHEGYLAEAMINFLALLGWHPTEDREVITRNEIIAEFEMGRVQRSGAVFNPEKLDWLNAHYIKKMSVHELANAMQRFMPLAWGADTLRFERALLLVRDRMKRLTDFKLLAAFCFEEPSYEAPLLVWKESNPARTKENLERLHTLLISRSAPKDTAVIHASITTLADERGRGEVFWPLRVALSGSAASPGPLEILDVIGIEESVARIQQAIKKLT